MIFIEEVVHELRKYFSIDIENMTAENILRDLKPFKNNALETVSNRFASWEINVIMKFISEI